jgi:sulfite reductase alpha subunit-like flavoprotein
LHYVSYPPPHTRHRHRHPGSYAKFNAAARMLRERLVQLGGREVVPPAFGDEQAPLGLEGDADEWLTGLWAALLARWPLPPGTVVDDTLVMPVLPFALVPVEAEAEGELGGTAPAGAPAACDTAVLPRPPGVTVACIAATVVSSTRLTAEDWSQDVRHIVLDIGDAA